MIGVCESLAYAKAAGLDANAVVAAIGGGAAGSWAMNHLGLRVVAGDFVSLYLALPWLGLARLGSA